MMLFTSSKSMTWTYRHEERAGQAHPHSPSGQGWQEGRAPSGTLPAPFCAASHYTGV